MNNICPKCLTETVGEKKATVSEKGLNALSRYGYTSTAGKVGEHIGGALGSIFGLYGYIAGAVAGKYIAKNVVGEFYDENIDTTNNKPLSYCCPYCGCEWDENDINSENVLRRHFSKLYDKQSKPLPIEPEKEGIAEGDAKRKLCTPLYVLAFMFLYDVVMWAIYLLSLTLVDCRNSGNPFFGFLFLGSLMFSIGYAIYRYFYTQREYEEAMYRYHEELPKAIAYNKTLEERLKKKLDESIARVNKTVSGEICNTWLEQNHINDDNQKGVLCHINMKIKGMYRQTGQLTLYFYNSDGSILKDTDQKYCTNDGQVAVGMDICPKYDDANYEDIQLFMPYEQLHIQGKAECCIKVLIWNGSYNVCQSKPIFFEFFRPHASNSNESQNVNLNTKCSNYEEQIAPTVEPQIGTLFDNFGSSYQLQEGENTIGRKANSSPASIQIETDDKTMSRNHAVVEVRNAGGQFIHILKNGANKNPSFHNGVLIGPSDQLILNNGDRLRLGNTELTFKK